MVVAGGRPMTAAACVSVDCPVLFERHGAQKDLGDSLDLCRAIGLF